MRREQPDLDRPSSVRPETVAADTADVLVRNYDFQWGYDVELLAERTDAAATYEKRYYLQPGASRREVDALEPGTYDVRVRLDGERGATGRCRVGAGPERAVLVELGNGAVSVHEGLYR